MFSYGRGATKISKDPEQVKALEQVYSTTLERSYEIFTRAISNHDAPLLCDMFRAMSTSQLYGARNASPLHAIARALPDMAAFGMREAVVEALNIGTYAGGGFVTTGEPGDEPLYAGIDTLWHRAGEFALPIRYTSSKSHESYVESIWKVAQIKTHQTLKSRVFARVAQTIGLGATTMENVEFKTGGSESEEEIHEGIEASDEEDRAIEQTIAVVEVRTHRVTLPHLGDHQTLKALVGMGPKHVAVFDTPSLVVSVTALWDVLKWKFYWQFVLFSLWLLSFLVFAESVARRDVPQSQVAQFAVVHAFADVFVTAGVFYFGFYELRQHRRERAAVTLGSDANFRESGEHLFWNVEQRLTCFCVLASLVLHAVDELWRLGLLGDRDDDERKALRRWSLRVTGVTSIVIWVGLLHYLRGFDSTAPIIRMCGLLPYSYLNNDITTIVPLTSVKQVRADRVRLHSVLSLLDGARDGLRDRFPRDVLP